MTKSKRRDTLRQRSSKRQHHSPGSFLDNGRGSHSWLGESLSVIVIAVSLYLCLSVFSHHYRLRSLYNNPQEISQPLYEVAENSPANLMGPVGHVYATIMTGFFGYCAFLPSLWLIWIAYLLWRWDEEDHFFAEVTSYLSISLGLGVSLFFASSLLALLGGEYAGGSIGIQLTRPFLFYIGYSGTLLFFMACLIPALTYAMHITIGEMVYGIFRATRLTIATVPRVLQSSMSFIWDNFVWLLAHIVTSSPVQFLYNRKESHSDEDQDDDESYEEGDEFFLPKPKRRTNTIEEDEDYEYDEDEKENDEEYNIVVERRSQLKRASKRDIHRARKRVLSFARYRDQAEKYAKYEPPSLDLLKAGETSIHSEDDESLKFKSKLIEEKLKDFNINGKVTHVHPGPVITLFEFEPAPGVKVGKIAALQDDLAMSLRASSLRIIAPIPRKGTVGIEVPNKFHDIVRLRDVLESEEFINADSSLSVPLGKDTYGNPVVIDVALMPHVLMAGATGTGKSVSINAFLVSLLYRANPAELGLILIDPKILELSVYEGIPHLRVPVVTDARKAKAVLQWAVTEMDNRYRMMQKFGVRSIDGYNKIVKGEAEESQEHKEIDKEDVIKLTEDDIIAEGVIDSLQEEQGLEKQERLPLPQEELQPLAKLVIVIDELADLMLSSGREVEELITRLAQKARAAGIHIVIATQRPSVDVITGLIKANFPARLSFRVSSRVDSRTILDGMGAEKLLGRGDMLFMRPGAMHLQRVHGSFVSDSEVGRVVSFIKERCEPCYDQKIIDECEKALQEEGASSDFSDGIEEEYDQFYDKALALVVEKGQASTSMIQRAFRIGYNRAARIIDTMEREGVVGPMDGAKPRQILLPTSDDDQAA